MKLRIIREENQKISSWSGGKTREIAIFPEDADYLDRDFIWRLSTADSDKEESSFSRLEGFDRILMVLKGDVVLAHGQKRSVHLGELEQDSFDGGTKTKCFGRLEKDYNLIMAKGCRGSLEVIELSREAREVDLADSGRNEEDGSGEEDSLGEVRDDIYRSMGFYCLEGYAVISLGEKSEMIRPGEQAIIDLEPGETGRVSLMGEGRCVKAGVAFAAGEGSSDEKRSEGMSEGEELDPKEQKSDPESFARSYSLCMSLLMRNNKWSKMMRRQGADGVYYDRALSKALSKLEKRYTTTVIWAIGCLICFVPAILFEKVLLSIGLAALFSVLHLLVIAPWIYFRSLPNPIGAHMKSVDELNAFEKIHHQEDISDDPHMDRVMRKYASDDDNYFTDEKSVLYRLVKKK